MPLVFTIGILWCKQHCHQAILVKYIILKCLCMVGNIGKLHQINHCGPFEHSVYSWALVETSCLVMGHQVNEVGGFFFFFSSRLFFGPQHMEFLGHGSDLSCSCHLPLHPLTKWVSWCCRDAAADPTVPQQEFLYTFFLINSVYIITQTSEILSK